MGLKNLSQANCPKQNVTTLVERKKCLFNVLLNENLYYTKTKNTDFYEFVEISFFRCEQGDLGCEWGDLGYCVNYSVQL